MQGLKSRPTIYAHPADDYDDTGVVRASSAIQWTYSPGDGHTLMIPGPSIELLNQGVASYARYRADRERFAALASGKKPSNEVDAKFGQDAAGYVFGFRPASGLQPSAWLSYEAILRLLPPAPQQTAVSLKPKMSTSAHTMLSKGPKMAGFAQARAEVCNEEGFFFRCESKAPFQWPMTLTGDSPPTPPTYTVLVDPGEPVKIGEVMVGLGFAITSGTAFFVTSVLLNFAVNPPGTPDSGPELLDPYAPPCVDPDDEGSSFEPPEDKGENEDPNSGDGQ